MKKIFFIFAIVLTCLSTNAQTLKVVKDGKLMAQFWGGDGYEFVFEDGDISDAPQQLASFELSKKYMKVGEEFTQLVISESDGKVTYTSSNLSVARVDASSGKVTALAKGEATINAVIASSSAYYALYASYDVIVSENVNNDPSQITVTGGCDDIYISKATLTAYANIPSNINVFQLGIYCSTEPEPNNENGITIIANNATKSKCEYQLLADKLEMNQKYFYRSFVYIPSTSSYYYGDILSFTTENITKVTSGEIIDLGLSVKWCSHNLGATSAEGSGNKYAWGELTPYSGSYAYYSNGAYINIGNNICGTEYDVAKVTLGGKWRLPSYYEMQALFTMCAYARTEINGVQGYIIEGRNRNSIFIPYGHCNIYSGFHTEPSGYSTHYYGSFSGFMTGQLSTESGSKGRVYSLMFDINEKPLYPQGYLWYSDCHLKRDDPQAVRPVYQDW